MKISNNAKTNQMKNSIQSFIGCHMQQLVVCLGIILISFNVKAQIPPNAINADPSAKAITQVPLGPNIVGNAVLKFKFTNEATSSNSTGQIPANSVRLTLSFPGPFAYTSVNSIPKFVVEDEDTEPYGVVHLVNNQLILEGEIIDLLVNVRSVANGVGTVTFNVDRTTPITVGNMLTSNDNTSSNFTAAVTLPVNLFDLSLTKQNCTAKLSWKTASEINVTNYVLEVSNNNGATYQPAGTVAAHNTASESAYSITYQMSNNNAYLYRIRINEMDGSYTYSTVARTNSGCGKGNELSVYPSPAISNITLSVSNDALMNTKATIVDVTGKTHMSVIVTGNTKNIDVSKLAPGMYIIRLDDGSNARFMKQ